MKRIGILTYQNALNFGAAFQCRALYRFVRNHVEDKVEVLDYTSAVGYDKNSIRSVLRDRSLTFKSKVKMSLNVLCSIFVRQKFRTFYSDVAFSNHYNQDTFAQSADVYDVFLIGSDQLWNFVLNGGDTNYLLPFVKQKNRIATYATSLGKENIPAKYLKVFVESVKDIPFLSVREGVARNYIESLLPGKTVNLVADPVFLLQGSDWESLFEPVLQKQGPSFYLFHKKFYEKALSIANVLNIDHGRLTKICGGLSALDFLNPKVKSGLFFGPTEALQAIANSEVVFTDSFHCVAMSIILHVDFYVFLTGDKGRDARIENLLYQTGLCARIVTEDNYSNESINWDIVDQNVRKMRDQSRAYLIDALSNLL